MEYRTIKFLSLLILPHILYSIFYIPAAAAAGLEVSPAKLEIELPGNKAYAREIVVANPTADVQIFEIYADDFDELFEFHPQSFTLDAGERKTVTITVKPNARRQNQLISTTLSIVSKPLADSKFEAYTGVKIPISLEHAAGADKFLHYLIRYYQILAVLLVCAAFAYFSFFKPKKPQTV